MSKKPAPIVAKKSSRDGCVRINVALKSYSYGDSIRIEGSADITTDQARSLAAELTALADDTDAKVAKKAAAEERRKVWRDREVAAGRMKIFTTQEFFGRGR